MKKILINICYLSLVAFIASCSHESDLFTVTPNESGEGNVSEINVYADDFIEADVDGGMNATTRSAVAIDGDGKYEFVWGADDVIGIFPNEGNQIGFSMTNGAGTKNAVFTGGGWGLKTSATYSAYYPLVPEFYLDKTKIPFDITGQKQSGNGSYDHIGTLDYMTACNSGVSDAGTVNFNFKHEVSVLHFLITMPEADTYNSIMLQSGVDLTLMATANLTNGKVKATETSAVQLLELENVSLAANEVLDAYMVIFPVDLTDKTLNVKIYGASGKSYTCAISNVNLQAGYFYKVTRTATEDPTNTGLPICFVNTPCKQSAITHDDWQANSSMTILMPDGTIDYHGTMQVKGRGNSTWGYPKKPYALKLDKKEKILGMKKHKRWCLMANWMDRTMMRNAVAFEISRNTELAWTPSGKFVEVVFNGVHRGNYYLCEQIKVDENRVNIAELDPTATEGEGITGGFIFELDTYYDEEYKFRSATKNFPWMFKDPDVVNEAQFNWVQNYVNEMEDALYDATKFANREFADYMNLESYVDWWFVNELSMNGEIGHPKSCYMHKDANGKMTAGPVWDYDWGTFTPGAASSFRCKNGLYYPRLFADPTFVAMVKTRWTQFKPAFETNIPAFIDATKDQIKKSDQINAPMWPIGGSKPNGDETMSFEDAVERLKAAYLAKLSWLDTQIQNW